MKKVLKQAEKEEAALEGAAGRAERERTGELDRLYPRAGAGRGRHRPSPTGSKARFIAVSEGVIFYKPGSITGEKKVEADAKWTVRAGRDHSLGEKEEEKKEVETSRKSKV